MFDYELLKIFYPFILLIILAVIYLVYFYRVKLITLKYWDIIKGLGGKHEKDLPLKMVFPEVTVINRYSSYEKNFDHLFTWSMSGIGCFLAVVSTHVISGWSFYSTSIVIGKGYRKNNVVISYGDLNSVFKFVRDLKRRGATFYVYPLDKNRLDWLSGEEIKLIDNIFMMNKRSMVDFYDGRLMVTMGGNFFSYLIKPYDLSNLILQLQRCFPPQKK